MVPKPNNLPVMPNNIVVATFTHPTYTGHPHPNESPSFKPSTSTPSAIKARGEAYTKTLTAQLTTKTLTITPVEGHNTIPPRDGTLTADWFDSRTAIAADASPLAAAAWNDLLPRDDLDTSITRYCTCPSGSSAHNKDVLMPDGKYQNLSACCDDGGDGIREKLAEDGSLICYRDDSYGIQGLQYFPGWEKPAVGGQNCVNHAIICPGHPKACCSGLEFMPQAKRADAPTATTRIPNIRTLDAIYSGPYSQSHSFTSRTKHESKPTSFASTGEDHDLKSRTTTYYAKCAEGKSVHNVDFCVPNSRGKRQTISACCDGDATSVKEFLACGISGDLQCHGPAGSWLVGPGSINYDIEINEGCINGGQPCLDHHNACCFGDEYLPDKKHSCNWSDAPDASSCDVKERDLEARGPSRYAKCDKDQTVHNVDWCLPGGSNRQRISACCGNDGEKLQEFLDYGIVDELQCHGGTSASYEGNDYDIEDHKECINGGYPCPVHTKACCYGYQYLPDDKHTYD